MVVSGQRRLLRFRRSVDLTVFRGACKTETQGLQHSLNVVGAARRGAGCGVWAWGERGCPGSWVNRLNRLRRHNSADSMDLGARGGQWPGL